jgi:hypothetical protein
LSATAISKRILLVILLLAIAAGGFYLYRMHRVPRAPASGSVPDLLGELPTGAPAVLFINFATLRASPLAAQLTAMAPPASEDRDYAAFVNETGFDYARDLDRVAAVVWPGPPATSTLALAEGRFDRDKIIRYALRYGTMTQQQGAEVYEVSRTNPAKKISFTFLTPNRMALSDGRDLGEIMRQSHGNETDPAMQERIRQVAGADFFLAARVDDLPRELSLPKGNADQFDRLLRSIQGIAVAGRIEGERLNLSADADCDSVKDAFELATVLDGLRFLGRAALANPKNRQGMRPEEAALLDMLLRAGKMSRDGPRVRLRLELTPAMLGAPRNAPAAATPLPRQ